MASSESKFDPCNSDTFQQSNHKKRRKIGDNNSLTHISWRSETQQKIYTSKLAQHLRHVLRRNSPAAAAKPISGREVRVTADRVLAATAKGRTRWSRAILASRLNWWKLRKKAKKVRNGSVKRKPEIRRRLPVVQKKVRVLSRLVPGCRKVSLPNLLEEATDYISALEMQVRAMTALAELLAGGVSPESRP